MATTRGTKGTFDGLLTRRRRSRRTMTQTRDLREARLAAKDRQQKIEAQQAKWKRPASILRRRSRRSRDGMRKRRQRKHG
jgi:hypothetical protein